MDGEGYFPKQEKRPSPYTGDEDEEQIDTQPFGDFHIAKDTPMRLSLLTGGAEQPIPKEDTSRLKAIELKADELDNQLSEATARLASAAANRAALAEARAIDRDKSLAQEVAECSALQSQMRVLQSQLLYERGARERAEGELASQSSAVLRLEEQVKLALGKPITLPAPTVIQAPPTYIPLVWEVTGKRQDGSLMKMTLTPK